jgi:hypothetical protein
MLNSRFIKYLLGSCRDLAPIVAVVLIFQMLIIKQPLPNPAHLISGSLFLILGLTLFVQGLEISLFPLGEDIAYDFARKGSLAWLLVFAFCLGFSAAIAEPALIAAAQQAADIASQGNIIDSSGTAKADYAWGLRVTVALSIGLALIVGVLRIIRGWPVYAPVFICYLCVAVITPFAPEEIIGIAYDAGGIATSSITVPLVTALGVGLATAIKGRNPLTDGFGLVVVASLMPIIFVLVYGMTV